MMRHCDGHDENLVREITRDVPGAAIYEPCSCGLVFDDVYRSVIFPHHLVQPRLTDAQVDLLVAQLRRPT